jgi:hypothetical protein
MPPAKRTAKPKPPTTRTRKPAQKRAPEPATRKQAKPVIVPLIVVNIVAVIGQINFLTGKLHGGKIAIQGHVISWEAILFALAVESIAVYLAYQAHLALMANDSSIRLRAGSYGFGFGIGYMNFTHYATSLLDPNTIGVIVGLMSASSPILWGIHSRRENRDALKARNLIEDPQVRLGSARLMWHPIRSLRVMRHASWSGVNVPALAIAAWEETVRVNEETVRVNRADDKPDPEPPPVKKRTHLPHIFTSLGTPNVQKAIEPVNEGDENVNGRKSIYTNVLHGDFAEDIKGAKTKSDAIRILERNYIYTKGVKVPVNEYVAILKDHGWNVTPALVRNIQSQDRKRAVNEQRNVIHIAGNDGQA